MSVLCECFTVENISSTLATVLGKRWLSNKFYLMCMLLIIRVSAVNQSRICKKRHSIKGFIYGLQCCELDQKIMCSPKKFSLEVVERTSISQKNFCNSPFCWKEFQVMQHKKFFFLHCTQFCTSFARKCTTFHMHLPDDMRCCANWMTTFFRT